MAAAKSRDVDQRIAPVNAETTGWPRVPFLYATPVCRRRVRGVRTTPGGTLVAPSCGISETPWPAATRARTVAKSSA